MTPPSEPTLAPASASAPTSAQASTPAFPAPDIDRPCPCGLADPAAAGRTLPYAACCGRYHAGPLQGLAPHAEALMRSRYSAFVLDLSDYLLASWHPSTRPASLSSPEPGLQWLGLQVKRHTPGVDPDHATVEFVARNKLRGRAHRLHEVSRFVRERGRWLYVDGE